MHDIIRQLDQKRARAAQGGGEKRIASQHAKGKLTARERIDMLLKLLDDYDVILLNELWGCWWSSFHTLFFRHAVNRGFFVCGTPVTLPPFNSFFFVACLACWS